MNRNRLAFFLAVIGALLLGFLLLSNVRAQETAVSPLIEQRYERWYEPQNIPFSPADGSEIQRSPDQPQEISTAGEFTKVVYQALADGEWDIYKLDKLAYGVPTPLVVGSSDDFLPRLTAQRDKVVFVSDRSGTYDIYTIGLDGSDLRRLTFQNALDSLPTWSPNGRNIAFVSDRDGNPEIYLMSAEGSGLQRLTYSAAIDLDPAFSPDGKKIAWVEMVSDRAGVIKVMNVDGSAQQAILGPFAYVRTPAWSPGGDAIAMELDWEGDGWLDVARFYFDELEYPSIHPGMFLQDITMGSWISGHSLMTGNIYYMVSGGNLYVDHTSFEDHSRVIEYEYPRAFYPWGEGDTQAPMVKMERLPRYTRLPVPEINWWAMDRGPSGIDGFVLTLATDIYSYGISSWIEGDQRKTDISELAYYSPGDTYYFRINARDNAGNESNPDGVFWEGHTTFYSHDLYSYVYDQRGHPLAGVPLIADGAELVQPATGMQGFAHGRYIFGYTNLTVFAADGLTPRQTVGLYLPNVTSFNWMIGPTENLLANGDFQEGQLEPAWLTTGPADPVVQVTPQESGIISYIGQLGQVVIPVDDQVIDPPSNFYSEAGALARKSDGTLYAFWGDNIYFPSDPNPDNTNLFFSYKTPTGVWSEPEVLNPESTYYTHLNPQAVFDSTGVLHVLWVESQTGTSRIQVRRLLPGGTWAPIENVFTAPNNVYILRMKAVIDASDRLHFIIHTSLDELLYGTRPAGGSWAVPVTLTSIHKYDSYDLAVDPANGVHVIYYQLPTDVYHPGLMQHRSKPAGGSWGAVETLRTDINRLHPEMQLVIDDDGRWHLLYSTLLSEHDGRVFYWLREADGAWRAPVRLDNPEIEHYVTQLKLILRPDGDLLTCWVKLFGTSVRVRDGGAWTVEMNTEYLFDPYSAISDGEKGFYTFERVENAQHLRRFPIPENASGSISQTVTLPADLHAPTLALNLRGEVYRNGGTFEILINDTVVYSTTTPSASWEALWVDLAPWSGQQVTVKLQVINPSLFNAVEVQVDNISLGAWTTQVVEQVEPAVLPADNRDTMLTLRGENFYGTPEVWLGAQPLANVQVVNENTIRATIPVRLLPGRYDLKVFQSGELQNPVFNAVLVGTELFLPLAQK